MTTIRNISRKNTLPPKTARRLVKEELGLRVFVRLKAWLITKPHLGPAWSIFCCVCEDYVGEGLSRPQSPSLNSLDSNVRAQIDYKATPKNFNIMKLAIDKAMIEMSADYVWKTCSNFPAR